MDKDKRITELEFGLISGQLKLIERQNDFIIKENSRLMALVTDLINKLNDNTTVLKQVLVDIQAGTGNASPELEAAINANSDQVSAIRAAVPVVPAVG